MKNFKNRLKQMEEAREKVKAQIEEVETTISESRNKIQALVNQFHQLTGAIAALQEVTAEDAPAGPTLVKDEEQEEVQAEKEEVAVPVN